MSEFFVRRPIVAIVIAILMMIIGAVCPVHLPIAQYPNIVPPEIQVQTHYTGADAQTIEQSVATPIEQQMSGVDNMNYMYSINANNGVMRMIVNFDLKTDPNIDQVLAQLRVAQAESQLPADVRNYGVTVKKSPSAPLILIALSSPRKLRRNFLANYAYINLIDPLTRVPGISHVQVFGAGQYAMRLWVKPDQLAKLNITVPEIISAVQQQNTVNPAGQVGGDRVRLVRNSHTPSVRRAGCSGGGVRRNRGSRESQWIDRSAQRCRPHRTRRADLRPEGALERQPSAVLALLPAAGLQRGGRGQRRRATHGAIERAISDRPRLRGLPRYTLAVTEGIREIVKTLLEALVLVIIVVFVFLQGWRATLIPLLAVPVSLIGTFALFPLLGFSINYALALWTWCSPSGWWWTMPSWWSRRWNITSKTECLRERRR